VVWTWPRRHLVAYPVRGGGAINLVAVTPGAISGASWSEPGDPDALRAAFTDAELQARALLAAVTQTTRWALADLAPLPRWTAKGVTLLGDAAHPMRPYLAQGAAMAIEDAEALARHLTTRKPLQAALTAYEAERRPRAARVQAASRRNGTVFHLPAPAAALAFGAAAVLDRAKGGPVARMDWLYGYRPPTN
jgi:salicylate hydroxylase